MNLKGTKNNTNSARNICQNVLNMFKLKYTQELSDWNTKVAKSRNIRGKILSHKEQSVDNYKQ